MNGHRPEKGMTLIVKTAARLTLGFIMLYGIYVALNGHLAPGGGFAGGVIITLSFVLIMLAFGKETALKKLHTNTLRLVVVISGLLFLYVVTGRFSRLGNEFTIPLSEMAMIGAGLFAVFVALVLASKADKDSE